MIEIRNSEAFASPTTGPATYRRPAEAVDPNGGIHCITQQQPSAI